MSAANRYPHQPVKLFKQQIFVYNRGTKDSAQHISGSQ